MASGSKTTSVFTDNDVGGTPGKTGQQKSQSVPGGTILSAYPMDNVHGVTLPNVTGDTMLGGPDNLKHSLSGASAVQKSNSRGGKTEKSGI